MKKKEQKQGRKKKKLKQKKKKMKKQDRILDCFIQINTGEEEQKAGVLPEDSDAFITLVRDELGLRLRGLIDRKSTRLNSSHW